MALRWKVMSIALVTTLLLDISWGIQSHRTLDPSLVPRDEYRQVHLRGTTRKFRDHEDFQNETTSIVCLDQLVGRGIRIPNSTSFPCSKEGCSSRLCIAISRSKLSERRPEAPSSHRVRVELSPYASAVLLDGDDSLQHNHTSTRLVNQIAFGESGTDHIVVTDRSAVRRSRTVTSPSSKVVQNLVARRHDLDDDDFVASDTVAEETVSNVEAMTRRHLHAFLNPVVSVVSEATDDKDKNEDEQTTVKSEEQATIRSEEQTTIRLEEQTTIRSEDQEADLKKTAEKQQKLSKKKKSKHGERTFGKKSRKGGKKLISEATTAGSERKEIRKSGKKLYGKFTSSASSDSTVNEEETPK